MMSKSKLKERQVVHVSERKLECSACGDTLFSKDPNAPSPSKDPYLWYADEALVCDSCGRETTAGALVEA